MSHALTWPEIMSRPFAFGDPRHVGPALRVFTQIAKAWCLTEMEQSAILGQPVDVAFVSLKAGAGGILRPRLFNA